MLFITMLFVPLVEYRKQHNHPAAKTVVSATKLLYRVWLTMGFLSSTTSDKMFAQHYLGKYRATALRNEQG